MKKWKKGLQFGKHYGKIPRLCETHGIAHAEGKERPVPERVDGFQMNLAEVINK